MVDRCVSSLRQSETEHVFNIVLIESGADKIDVGQDATIMWELPEFNYNGALKLGINSTSNDWVVLANNDLIFHPGWMSEIFKVHDQFPLIKSFSPWNTINAYHDSIYPNFPVPMIIGYRVCYEVCGWCLVAKREVLETIDLSDRVNLWYSDNIYADELLKHKFVHALVKNSLVDHLCTQTIDFTKYDSRADLLKYQGKE
jgi:GT2 family glycosyltransferase